MEAKEFYQIREHLHRHPELSGQEIPNAFPPPIFMNGGKGAE